MKTGALLSSYLILSLIAFGLVDVGLWVTGQQTMSQWVIKYAKKYELVGFVALGFCLLLCAGGLVLAIHWELPCILFNKFCEIEI